MLSFIKRRDIETLMKGKKEFGKNEPGEHFKFLFHCSHCNNCCKEMTIVLNPSDILRISEFLKIGINEFHAKYTYFETEQDSGIPLCKLRMQPDCMFLIKERCSIHSARPVACKMFPISAKLSLENGNVKKELSLREFDCKGIGKGKAYSCKEYFAESGAEQDFEQAKEWNKFMLSLREKGFPDNENLFDFFVELFYKFDETLMSSLAGDLNIKKSETQQEKLEFIQKVANGFFMEAVEEMKK